MSITTFIIVLICAVVVIPSLVAFICCFLLGLAQAIWENMTGAFKRNKTPSLSIPQVISKNEARAEAGKILLARIDKDENTTFH